VSTRTISNHYGDKASLFRAVIVDSAQRAAQHQIDVVRPYLSRVTDLEEDLVAFGVAWASPDLRRHCHSL
jgi:AcrR family transcriptional regulator